MRRVRAACATGILAMLAGPALGDAQTEGNLTRWTVGDVRLKMRTNPNGSADFHAAFQQTQQSADWARQNLACSYLALAVRARDEEGFPSFSLDLVCPALSTADPGTTIDCDGFMYRAPGASQATRFDVNLAGRGCP